MIGAQLQKAIYDRLKAAGIAGGRIYDRIPSDAVSPYVVIGDEQAFDDGDQCADMFEVFPDIHVWSEAVGKVEAKQISEQIRQAMKADFSVDDYAVVLHEFRDGNVMPDPEELTTHAILTFRFLLQPA